jgi:hypothetical protein
MLRTVHILQIPMCALQTRIPMENKSSAQFKLVFVRIRYVQKEKYADIEARTNILNVRKIQVSCPALSSASECGLLFQDSAAK